MGQKTEMTRFLVQFSQDESIFISSKDIFHYISQSKKKNKILKFKRMYCVKYIKT